MNCPMHNLIFTVARTVLPRAAAAAVRVRLGLPLREVRRRARPDPRARPDHGRLALLRAPPSRRPTRSSTCSPSCSACSSDFGLDDFYLELSTRDDLGQVHRHRRGVGGRHRDRSSRPPTETGLELVPDPGGAAFYGPKISVQARDAIGRTWQMSTIQYDFNQPAASAWSTRRPTAPRQQPVMIHSREVRLDRAVPRRARRALRRRLPAVARAGAGRRHPDHRRARRLPRTTSRRSCGRSGIRVEVDTSDDRMQKKIRNAQKQKVPFMLHRRRRGRRGGRGVLPLPRRHAEERRADRRTPSRRSSTAVADRVQV